MLTSSFARRRLPWCLGWLLLALPALSCVDKDLVSTLAGSPRDARLGVEVGLGGLLADGDITDIRVIASYTAPGGVVVLRSVTVPYTQGEVRDISMTLEISQCLRALGIAPGASAACPVQVSVEVLSSGRVLARDVLPLVQLREGESTSTPALAARGVTSVGLLINSNPAPASLSVVIGSTASATAVPRDAAGVAIAGRTIVWSSSAPTVASVSGTGVITGVAAGAATITAATGTGTALLQASLPVTVTPRNPATVVLTPATAAIDVGGTQPLTAVVRDSSGVQITPTPTLVWTSSQPTIANVTSSGVVTALAAGSAIITARTSNGFTGTATFTVSAVPATVTLAPATANLFVAGTQTLTATVRDAAGVAITPTPALQWLSSATAVATVSQAGAVVAVAAGTSTVTARTTNGVIGSATITVSSLPTTLTLSPSSATLAVASTQLLTPSVRDPSGVVITPTPAVVWQSTDNAVATVSSTGLVTAIALGSATITARTANNIVGSATILVAVSGSFNGRVFDYSTEAGVPGATVTISSGQQVVRSVPTDAQGNYNSGTLFGGPFELRAVASGYVSADIRNAVLNGVQTLEALPLVRSAAGVGTISGNVLNATTGQPIVGVANLELYTGANSTTGSPIAIFTATQAFYQFSAIAGTYTLVARATNFSTSSRTVVSPGANQTAGGQNIFIAPTASVGSLRIVLSWGATPSDLDSHLTGPGPNQSTFWIFYAQPGSCTVSPFACLDVDHVDGNGPETLTIAQRLTGRYVYSVHNYSAGMNSAGDPGLSRSSARVDVYGSTGLVRSYSVPAQPGTLWTVFDWDGTTFRTINTVSGAAPPGTSAPFSGLLSEPLPWRIKKAQR